MRDFLLLDIGRGQGCTGEARDLSSGLAILRLSSFGL